MFLTFVFKVMTCDFNSNIASRFSPFFLNLLGSKFCFCIFFMLLDLVALSIICEFSENALLYCAYYFVTHHPYYFWGAYHALCLYIPLQTRMIIIAVVNYIFFMDSNALSVFKLSFCFFFFFTRGKLLFPFQVLLPSPSISALLTWFISCQVH